MSEQLCLVRFEVAPGIEALVVDRLLLLEVAQGFSSFPVSVHHHLNVGLSLAEQVTGRHKAIRFEVMVSQPELPALLQHLREEFAGIKLAYTVLPLIEHCVL